MYEQTIPGLQAIAKMYLACTAKPFVITKVHGVGAECYSQAICHNKSSWSRCGMLSRDTWNHITSAWLMLDMICAEIPTNENISSSENVYCKNEIHLRLVFILVCELSSFWINYKLMTHYGLYGDIDLGRTSDNDLLPGSTKPLPKLTPYFDSAAVDVWEWISSFISHFTRQVITCPCWHYSVF